MNWYQNLYVGKTFQKKKRRIRRRVKAGRPVPDLFLILVRPDTDHNQLEIIPQCFLKQSFPEAEELLVVGIASGMREAKELLRQMTEDVYRETGTAEIKKYFLSGAK